MDKVYLERTHRLFGDALMESIGQARIIILGIGGVGSWCAEGLVRSGVAHLTLVDADDVSPTNLNRQLMATTKTIGRPKAEALKERLLEINPDADITAIKATFSEENAASFNLDSYDYIIDAIDSLKDKITLIMEACRTRATFFSSMGAACKVDPTKIRVAEFWEVRGCPLGSILRKRMRQKKLTPAKKFLCIYDDEVLPNLGGPKPEGEVPANALDEKKAVINGSTAPITAIFGMTLSGLVLRDLRARQIRGDRP